MKYRPSDGTLIFIHRPVASFEFCVYASASQAIDSIGSDTAVRAEIMMAKSRFIK